MSFVCFVRTKFCFRSRTALLERTSLSVAGRERIGGFGVSGSSRLRQRRNASLKLHQSRARIAALMIAPEPIRQKQDIRDGAGVRSMQPAADISVRAGRIVELLPSANGRLDATELGGEAPPGRG